VRAQFFCVCAFVCVCFCPPVLCLFVCFVLFCFERNRDSSSYYDSPARGVCLNSGDNLLLVSTVADCLERGCGALRPQNHTPNKQNPKWVFVFAPCRFCDLINTAPPPTFLSWASRGQSAPKIAPTYNKIKKQKHTSPKDTNVLQFVFLYFFGFC
jgi:hypothetical protein